MFRALVASGDLNNETHLDEKKKKSKLKKKHCKNNGCNLSQLTAEQDLSYEEILLKNTKSTSLTMCQDDNYVLTIMLYICLIIVVLTFPIFGWMIFAYYSQKK